MTNKHKSLTKDGKTKTGRPYKNMDAEELMNYAVEYCNECINKQTQVATSSGKIAKVDNRHIPTIGYFTNHWMRLKKFDFYERTNIYCVLNNDKHPLFDTIKKIREDFDMLAEDIVANEGKGIFWAKNRLGMTDRVDTKNENKNSGELIIRTVIIK